MTKKERIALLEARIAQLEMRLETLERMHLTYGAAPHTPALPQPRRPWDGPGVIYGPPYIVTC